MLPNALGTSYNKGWTPGETETFTEGWTMKNVYDQTQLNVVVFIQNNITKEIFQVETIDSFAISTAVEDMTVSENNQFTLFPNPTSGDVNVLLSNKLNTNANLRVYDELGRVVLTKELYAGANLINLKTDGLGNGMYFIRIQNTQNEVLTGKLKVLR